MKLPRLFKPELPRHTYARSLGLATLGAAAFIGALATYHVAYANRIFPGVQVGHLALGGRTPNAAQDKLQSAWDAFAQHGIPLTIGGETTVLAPRLSSPTDPDFTYDLMHFDAEASARAAYLVGRQGSWWWRLVQPIGVRLTPTHVPPHVAVNSEGTLTFIRQTLPPFEEVPQLAQFSFDYAGNATVTPEASGHVLDEARLWRDLTVRLGNMSSSPITLVLRRANASITEADLLELLPQVRHVARDRTMNFSFSDQHWQAPAATWHRWLEAHRSNGELALGLSANAAEEFFAPIAAELDQPAKDAKFEIQDDRVAAFTPSQPGRHLDVALSVAAAEAIVMSDAVEEVPLSVTISQPKVSTGDANGLGIAEVIGIGTSNFAGSPKNRRHNIQVGAAKLNGVLIKSGEEFSLIKTLGTIDDANGYLQELVIKGDKTIPEFGGGLCQIGTTTFRAALASGLPILERRNHSYRVTYYEPAGTDATIYDPKPDFRFKNDTPSSILVQTNIKGDTLTFEFWGKKDGRLVDQTKSEISNIVKPPPTKIIQTEDLPVGQKKCTEHAHNGADAKFAYTVTYPDAEVATQVFKSHYVPWQEVCLVGVPKGTLPAAGSSDGTLLPSADAAGAQGNPTQQ